MNSILLYDTTLRDGAQGEKINFSTNDKLMIAERLDAFGFHYVEGGWPGSNPKDVEFFQAAKNIKFQNARLVAFGSTRKKHTAAVKDANIKAFLDAKTPTVAIFGKSWDFQVTEILQTTLEENLDMIFDSVEVLKRAGKEVIYDAEHFFDGYKTNSQYALETIKAAISAGADFIVLCDTNGGTLTAHIKAIMKRIGFDLGIKVGIHAHNDSGLAVANTLTAVECGATMVQGTINGYGERCGNADLTTVIPNLQLKMGIKCVEEDQLNHLTDLSRYVSEVANITPFNARPFVGKSAFTHKGGVHVDAVMKNPQAYEHLTPEAVGNKRRVAVSDLSGKGNIAYKAEEMGIELGGNGHDAATIAAKVKRLEAEGYQFDTADASCELLLKRLTGQYNPLFELKSFRVTSEKDGNSPCASFATIKIAVKGKEEITAAAGNGPINALDNALRKALHEFFSVDLEPMHLTDFKVRVIEGREGTGARVRVFIESRDQEAVWGTVGVSNDIIEAGWQAMEDAYQHKLAQNGR